MLFYVFFFLLTISLFHSFYGIYLLLTRKNKKVEKINDELPSITIQLPIYNEANVISQLIKAIFNLEYPKEKLEIQILDDSTDVTSEIIRNELRNIQTEFNFSHIKRNSRNGFKAGALNNALKSAKGDYIAVFDADFTPSKTFLLDIVKYIDQQHSCYQARWSFNNSNNSLLTKAQKLNLDHHFQVFQSSRYLSNNFLNFNGTAGIWKKSALLNVGCWEEYTIAEDLDTSLKAQLNGHKIKYINDLYCKSELPVDFTDLEIQQKRWIKGSSQVLRKYFWKVIKSKLSLPIKINALIFLSYNLIFPIILLIIILNPIFINNMLNNKLNYNFMNIYLLGGIFILIQHLYSQKRKITNLRYLPLLMLGSIGLSLSLSYSFLSGLFSKYSKFERTAKVGNRTTNYSNNNFSILFFFELVILLFYLIFIISLISNGQILTALFQLFFFFSFLLIIILRLVGYIKKTKIR